MFSQFLARQYIWWNVDLLAICNTNHANVDSVGLVKLKVQFLSVIFTLWCVLNLCLGRLYPENYRTLLFVNCQRP